MNVKITKVYYYMFKDLSELKQFIIWSKEQKVKSLKVGEVEFELSDIGLVEGLQDVSEQKPVKDLAEPAKSARLPDGNTQATDDEEMLFWSAR